LSEGKEKHEVNRKKNDMNDMAVYLSCLYGSEHQSFTDEEAQELLSYIRSILRFVDTYGMKGLMWLNGVGLISHYGKVIGERRGIR